MSHQPGVSHQPEMRHQPVLSANPRPAVFQVQAIDETGVSRPTSIAGEHALTVYLDKRELVTLMTLGAAPEYLVLGYLRNQRVVQNVSEISAVQVDWDTASCAVTSRSMADLGISCWDTSMLCARLDKQIVTTGCGQGTMFADIMSEIDSIRLDNAARLSQATLYRVMERVRIHESIYKQAGAVHGCALSANPASAGLQSQTATGELAGDILYFVEDVGRHNAVDAIAGWMWMHDISGDDKIFYTTGRLTSEMVIKCAQMRIPILVSRSGLTQMGHDLATQLNMTLIGRCQGKHFLLFTGIDRFEAAPPAVRERVTGLVLAGGQGRRMSADGNGVNKALQSFRQSTLIEHVLQRLVPQVETVIINMNEASPLFESGKHQLLKDEFIGFQGPLAGIHAGLKACRTPWLLCVPCDSPFFPTDLLERMLAAMRTETFDICVASSSGQWQPVFALIRVELAEDLEQYLRSGERKIDLWYRRHRTQVVVFEDPRAFLNFNTLDELQRNEH